MGDFNSDSRAPRCRSRIAAVRDASIRDVSIIVSILADHGIPSALWGVNAAACYGGGLCALDIELVVNGADQERVFAVLTSQGALPATPGSPEEARPTEFALWRKLAPSYRFRDRRRMRLCTPMYELPPTGDPIDDALLPFLVLYSAEGLGLRSVPAPELPNGMPRAPSESTYVPVSSFPLLRRPSEDPDGAGATLVPTFAALVQSVVHALLWHAEYLSLAWGQLMAELSELLRSRSSAKGHDGLSNYVDPRLSEFAEWMQAQLKGGADHEGLDRLRETCRYRLEGRTVVG